MATYTYDETGHMALFFIITVLFMILVPVTLSQISLAPSAYRVSTFPLLFLTCATSEGEIPSAVCECSACVDKRTRIRNHEKGTIFRTSITKKCAIVTSATHCDLISCRSLFITLGWLAFGLLSYKVATTKIENKIYDPFEILGIRTVSNDFKWRSIAEPCYSHVNIILADISRSSPAGYFGKGHQIPLQKALQNIVSLHLFILLIVSLTICIAIRTK
jgi:translocation protein SEC63